MTRFASPWSLALATVTVTLTAAACGSGGVSEASRSAFVDARANALCTVKKNAYATQGQLEATYQAEQRADIPASDEKQLNAMLEGGDTALDGEISARVEALCG